MERPNRRAAFDEKTAEGVVPADEGVADEGTSLRPPEVSPDPAPREQTLLDWLGHELRNPIAAIDLAVHSLRRVRDERLDRELAILERQSRQLGRVVLELLEMSRAASQASGGLAAHMPPARRERDEPPAEQPPTAGTTGPLRARLLLVEDNEDLSGLLRDLLAGWGFEVVTAGSALAALAEAEARAPDIALIDIGLPDRDGGEVARALRHSLATSVRLIAMSGYGQSQDAARALSAGFDEFLVKPLNVSRLRALLSDQASPPPPPAGGGA